MKPVRNIAVLGSTGSIGRNALDVIRAIEGIHVFGLSGHSRLDLLANQAAEFKPEYVVCSDPKCARDISLSEFPQTNFLWGQEALIELASHPQVDMVLAAIVGSAGLASTYAAVQAGKTVALANKETLVMAGDLITQLAKKTGATILPVDSEHSALFQCLNGNGSNDVRRLILTASGGPFRDWDLAQLRLVTVAQALAHPTWEMGKKITIDSATMMNKALEVIEARWLFDIPADRIEIVVHPQSIVHSMVEFCDGSTLAQLGSPDMKLPIQYALTYPDRVIGSATRMDWTQPQTMEFFPPDLERFPALELGFEVAQKGGTSGPVLNAANEVAVMAFLNGEIAFTDIASACREVLDQHNFESHPTWQQILSSDQWAREEISKWMVA
jgi:1-deoxy-D-xylulose-5-phosphate reductoisomerase